MADLRREDPANCCANLIARTRLCDPLTATTKRLTAALARPTRTGQPTPGLEAVLDA